MLKINVLENKTVSPSNSSNTHSQTNVIPLTSVKNSSPNGEEKVIGQGGIGKVIEDINNPGYVIKIFSKNTKLANLQEEAKSFNKYYGEGSAEVFQNDQGLLCIRMLRVPGKPLSQCKTDELPKDSKAMFFEMICSLNDLGIMHADLNEGNIMFDKDSKRFFPIDMSNNIYNDYYLTNPKYRSCIDEEYVFLFDSIMSRIPDNSAEIAGSSNASTFSSSSTERATTSGYGATAVIGNNAGTSAQDNSPSDKKSTTTSGA